MVVILLPRPSQMGRHFHLPVLVNEDVLGPDIPHFLPALMEVISRRQQGVHQVPQLRLLEQLVLQVGSVANFVDQYIGEIIVFDLGKKGSTLAIPLEPQSPSFWKE